MTAEAVAVDWDALLHPPKRPDRHARHGSQVVHREQQDTGGLCVPGCGDGILTRCGHLWDYVEFTDEPVTCKTCLRASP